MIFKPLAEPGRMWLGAIDPDAVTVVDATQRVRADLAVRMGVPIDHPDIAVVVVPFNSGLKVRASYVPGWPA